MENNAGPRLEAEAELARREVSAPDLPIRQEVRKADPIVEFVMAPKPEHRQPSSRQSSIKRIRKRL